MKVTGPIPNIIIHRAISLNSGEGPESPPPAESDGSRQEVKPPGPGHNPSGDDVLEDPAVKSFMKTFKAQILSVEPRKGEKVATRDIKDLAD